MQGTKGVLRLIMTPCTLLYTGETQNCKDDVGSGNEIGCSSNINSNALVQSPKKLHVLYALLPLRYPIHSTRTVSSSIAHTFLPNDDDTVSDPIEISPSGFPF